MLDWFAANLATILVSLALAGILALIVTSMIRSRKQGKTSCGCGCQGCALKGKCHEK